MIIIIIRGPSLVLPAKTERNLEFSLSPDFLPYLICAASRLGRIWLFSIATSFFFGPLTNFAKDETYSKLETIFDNQVGMQCT